MIRLHALAFCLIAAACGDDGPVPQDAADAPDTWDTTADGDVGPTDPTPEPVTPAECGFPAAGPTTPPAPFNDHTLASIDRFACFVAFATPQSPFDPEDLGGPWHTPFTIKFTVAGFESETPTLHLHENGFYRLHDEWYWFRLLNGERVPGVDDAPVDGPSFASIDAIYAALATVSPLPLDLVFIGGTGASFPGRLYSPRFYALAGLAGPSAERVFGLGGLLHFPPEPTRVIPERIFAFQLEYAENPTAITLARYFHVLSSGLPPEVSSRLRWLARSPRQEALANALRASGGSWSERVMTFADLDGPAAFEVYHPGLAAGFIRRVGPDEPVADLRPDEIAILARVPDDIPAVAAIVSAVPQTPLSHVALLAEARNTPNAWRSGVMDDGRLAEWAYLRTPVIVAVRDDGVSFRAISRSDYDTWRALTARTPPSLVPYPTPLDAPHTVALNPTGTRRTDVALIGGKSAGLTSFDPGPELAIPPAATAITVRAWASWFTPLEPTVRAVLQHPDFADRRLRFALLDGPEAFRAAFASDPGALAQLERWRLTADEDPVLGPILASGGVQAWLRTHPLPLEDLRAIRQSLSERFADLAVTQGLRFRSSSTVEDLPGFNGAGLYRSVTGFLEPQLQPGAGDRLRTVEAAIVDVFSSYWNAQAVNERAEAGIDHFAGRMAITVHPRFDDPLERANLVLTMTCNGWAAGMPCRLVINAQPGDASVTNPSGSLTLPEIIEVTGDETGAPTLRRVQASSRVEPGEEVVADVDALTMYRVASAHVADWLAEDGARLPAAERPRALTLDYELKHMAPGWPALASGEVLPARYIWRQARVLDRPPRVASAPDPWLGAAWPVTTAMPADLNPLATEVKASRCARGDVEMRFYTMRTDDPERPGIDPFVYKLWLRATEPVPGFDLPNQAFWVSHRGFAQTSGEGGMTLAFDSTHADLLGLDAATLRDGVLTLSRGEVTSEASCVEADVAPIHLGPEAFLESLLAESFLTSER